MIRRAPASRFVALLEPGAIHLAEYRQQGGSIGSVGPVRMEAAPSELREAAAELAARVEGLGGRDRQVDLVVRGFGLATHMLQLPPATPEIWKPIVEREARQLEPGIDAPVVAFSPCGTFQRGSHELRELLVGIAPRTVVDTVRSALADRRITLASLTVAPQAIRRALAEVRDSTEPVVVLAMLDSGPVICFFYDGELRLVSDPPLGETTGRSRAEVLRDTVERGVLHLRQQHHGHRPDRLLVAAGAGQETILSDLQQVYAGDPMDVRDLGTAGALIGAGTVADVQADDPLDLAGAEGRAGRTVATRFRTGLAVAVALAALWAVAGWLSAWVPARQTAALEEAVAARAEALRPLTGTLERRQAHAERLAQLGRLNAEYTQLESVLRQVGTAVPPGIRLDGMSLDRDDGEWRMELDGTAFAGTAAGAVALLHSLNADVQRRFRAAEVELTDFQYVDPEDAFEAGARAGVRFSLSLTVPAGEQAVS